MLHMIEFLQWRYENDPGNKKPKPSSGGCVVGRTLMYRLTVVKAQAFENQDIEPDSEVLFFQTITNNQLWWARAI